MMELLRAIQTSLLDWESNRNRSGLNFNIFEITRSDCRELPMCAFLAELLSPRGKHGQGALFLKTFCSEVLTLESFSSEDLSNARVETEVVIDGNRRIDILLTIGTHIIPIEVKIYAEDQDSQCADYYQYIVKSDKKTVLYYLTLDGHQPGDESRRDLIEGKQYRCISFSDNILNWVSHLLENSQIQGLAELKVVLVQYQQAIEHITNLPGKEITRMVSKYITSKENFHAARAVEQSLPVIKAAKLMSFLDALSNRLAPWEDQFPLVDRATDTDAKDFYLKEKKTWPSLNYLLPLRSDTSREQYVLRIEIENNLYFGVCSWNQQTKINKPTSDAEREAVLRWSGRTLHVNRTKWYYWWEYLPGLNDDTINFRGCNDSYEALYDEKTFHGTIEKIALILEDFFNNWNSR